MKKTLLSLLLCASAGNLATHAISIDQEVNIYCIGGENNRGVYTLAEGPGKAADSGSIIRIDPKSVAYVSDIRPQWVEITSSTACRISATARWRRNT